MAEADISFYNILSRYYDELFPLDADTFSFLRQSFAGRSPVTDAACGTGTYALRLAEYGFSMMGIDLDDDMIRIAKKKLESAPSGVVERIRFVRGRMENLQDFLDEKQGGVYCIGNSLVHLPDTEKIQIFLDGARNVLKDGGVLILQILNYDRILDLGITELPTLTGSGVRMVRTYSFDRDSGFIRFTANLSEGKEDGAEHETTLSLLPVRTNRLISLVERAGFGGVRVSGSFTGAPYGHDSFVTILTARK